MNAELHVEVSGALKAKLTPDDAARVAQIYSGWRAIDVTRVKCSKRTFIDHLEHNLLIAGPWQWRISDDVAYGDVWLYGAGRTRLGTMSVTSLCLPN